MIEQLLLLLWLIYRQFARVTQLGQPYITILANLNHMFNVVQIDWEAVVAVLAFLQQVAKVTKVGTPHATMLAKS